MGGRGGWSDVDKGYGRIEEHLSGLMTGVGRVMAFMMYHVSIAFLFMSAEDTLVLASLVLYCSTLLVWDIRTAACKYRLSIVRRVDLWLG
jgi:hypothetical protein